MTCASMFCAMTRICSAVRCRSVKRANAADEATINAEGPGDASTRGRLRIGLHQQAFFGGEELQQACRQRQAKAMRVPQCVEACEYLFPFAYRASGGECVCLSGGDPAGRQNVHREVQGQQRRDRTGRRPGRSVPPARSARQGACATMVADSGEVQDASMQRLYHAQHRASMCFR